MFGTPTPRRSSVNLGVLKTDEVNIIVHGHEPTLSELIVAASRDPEMIALAKKFGAKGGAVVLFAYFFAKLLGVADAQGFGLLGTPYGKWFLVELIGFVALLPKGLIGLGALWKRRAHA